MSCALQSSSSSGWNVLCVGGFLNFGMLGWRDGRFWVLVGCIVGIGFCVFISQGILVFREMYFSSKWWTQMNSILRLSDPTRFKNFLHIGYRASSCVSSSMYCTSLMPFEVCETACNTTLTRYDSWYRWQPNTMASTIKTIWINHIALQIFDVKSKKPLQWRYLENAQKVWKKCVAAQALQRA